MAEFISVDRDSAELVLNGFSDSELNGLGSVSGLRIEFLVINYVNQPMPMGEPTMAQYLDPQITEFVHQDIFQCRSHGRFAACSHEEFVLEEFLKITGCRRILTLQI